MKTHKKLPAIKLSKEAIAYDKEQNDKRAKEFLSCLGNGSGRITDEDENPEDYVQTNCPLGDTVPDFTESKKEKKI